MKDKLGDWRIAAVTKLAQDIPPSYSGGKAHKAGTPVYQTTHVKTKNDGFVGFTIPSSTALALDIAIRSSIEAKRIKKTIKYGKVATPDGEGKNVKNSSLSALYNYFGQSMIAENFSFQAIEAYSNHIVGTKLEGKIFLKRKGELKEFSSDEVERYVSTGEKLSEILPKLLNSDSPKGRQVWESFTKLKNFRDSTIHLKIKDQYSSQGEDDALFYQLLNSDIALFPKTAVDMISFFFTQEDEPRWLIQAKEKVKI